MGANQFGSTNGKDKRTGKERRQGEDRREATRSEEKGVLSTRVAKRRQQTRRTKDRKSES
jgi:hypothetical protein